MDTTTIAQLYARSPDFDIEKTMYQVEHITGRGGTGTDYTTPSCAAMLTTGLCVKKAPLCEKVSHPLSYYKVKKADLKKKVVPGGKEPGQTEPGAGDFELDAGAPAPLPRRPAARHGRHRH